MIIYIHAIQHYCKRLLITPNTLNKRNTQNDYVLTSVRDNEKETLFLFAFFLLFVK